MVILTLPVGVHGLIKSRARGNVYLAPDYRLYSLADTRLIKGYRAVHNSVVGKSNCGMTALLCSLGNFFYAASAVKQAVFTVKMQMYKF